MMNETLEPINTPYDADSPRIGSAQRSHTITITGWAILVLAFTVVNLWLFDAVARQTIIWRFTGMKFNSALCLLLLSITLLLTQYQAFPYRKLLQVILPIAVLIIASLSLAEYLFKINTGIDELFVREGKIYNRAYPVPGRIAFNSAAEFFLLALGLSLLRLKSVFLRMLSQFFFHTVTIISAVGLVGFLYGVSLYHSLFTISAMDIHTSVIFLALSLSAARLNPDIGIVRLFWSNNIGDKLARRLFVLITVLALAYGAGRLQLQRAGVVSIELSIAILVVVFLLSILMILWYIAQWMNKLDQERAFAEAEVRTMNAGLEKSVEERSLDIRKSEARYRSLIEQASDAIYIVDTKGNFTDANDSTCHMLGYNREELLKMNVEDIVDPYELKHDPLSHGQGNPKPVIRERRLRRKNGEIFDAEINAKMFTDDRVMVIARDITDRKRVENELRASEKKYKFLFDRNPVPLWMISKNDLKIIDVNSAAAELYGYAKEEMKSMTVRQFRSEENWARQTEDYQLPLQDSIIDLGVIKHLKKDGTQFSVHIVAHDILYEGQKVRLSMTQDVTEKEKAMQQLTALNENLQKQARELKISNSELEQFAYVASHDLQEPLRMITSFLDRLEVKYADLLDEKGKQYIHFATDGAKRMRQLILDLLDFSRVGRTDVELEKVDIAELLDKGLELYTGRIAELNANVSYANMPVLRTYRTPLMQVFQNLIGNSLKYRREDADPIIEIACEQTLTEYKFSVKDNGIGIGSEYFDRIFIVFQRLHNKNEYSGTGIGLAITKKIIENMGGQIWVESVEGKGSTFYFTVPKNL